MRKIIFIAIIAIAVITSISVSCAGTPPTRSSAIFTTPITPVTPTLATPSVTPVSPTSSPRLYQVTVYVAPG